MVYLVNVTSRAERDLALLYEEINAEYSTAALKWYRGLKKAILSLEERPTRCPSTRERGSLRHLLYGRQPNVYRILFTIEGEAVNIVHIRHGRRKPLSAH
jgi:plasmid stabilization system protein ParE